MQSLLRYPRIVTLLRHQCSLTITESIGCIEHRISEAVSNYGGREKCLKDAIASRHRLYSLYNSSPLEYWFFRGDRETLRTMRF